MARARGGRVILRLEDHDRQRCRAEYDAALLEDLAWLGFTPDGGPVRQSDPAAEAAYEVALDVLREHGLVYGCDCTRASVVAAAERTGRAWTGPGCPGSCLDRGLVGPVLRVALGGGVAAWTDELVGPCAADVAPVGDLSVRDRHGNWTYGFAVVVDDLRQGVDLVVRGRDLFDATPAQIRVATTLGRVAPVFAHHPLIRRPDGTKLSKADGASGIRELRSAGRTPEEVIGEAAAAVGLLTEARPVEADGVAALVAGR